MVRRLSQGWQVKPRQRAEVSRHCTGAGSLSHPARRRSTGASCRQKGQALRSTTCPAYGIWAPIRGRTDRKDTELSPYLDLADVYVVDRTF